MPSYICVTCGTQYAETAAPPAHCLICQDERQYVNPEGQAWTTLDELRRDHHNAVEEVEPGLFGIRTEPHFAIAQRALLIQTPRGNVLWDCVSLVDDATVDAVRARGGLKAIAVSHPHFYSSVVEWSRAFGGIPVYLHAGDRRWLMRPDPAVRFWDGECCGLVEGLTLIRCGGHFAGSTALHWAGGAGGRGALLTGDTVYVVADRRYVTFMRSYPNLIPLGAAAIRRIVEALAPYRYDRLYSAWPERVVQSGAEAAVARSAARYVEAIGAAG